MKKCMTFEQILNLRSDGYTHCEQIKVSKTQVTFRGDYGRLEMAFKKGRGFRGRDVVSLECREEKSATDKKTKCQVCARPVHFGRLEVPLEYIEAFAKWILEIES